MSRAAIATATSVAATVGVFVVLHWWWGRRRRLIQDKDEAEEAKEDAGTEDTALPEEEHVDDVEDTALPSSRGTVSPDGAVSGGRHPCSGTDVVLHGTKQQRQQIEAPTARDSHVPGTQAIYVRTFGCSHNGSDSEAMMGLLRDYGYRLTDHLEDCDLCLVNSCTVKNPSQDAMMTVVKKAQATNKAVVVAGCVPQSDRNLAGLEGVSVLGTTQIGRTGLNYWNV